MKVPDYDYARATTLAQAIDLLQQRDSAVPLAGGQSLLTTLDMRLSSPELLVDINELSELKGIVREDDAVRVGALTRHAELLRSDVIAREFPLLAQAMHHVAHPAIRGRALNKLAESEARPFD